MYIQPSASSADPRQQSAWRSTSSRPQTPAGARTEIKPSSNTFKTYIEEVVRPKLQEAVSRTQVSVIIDLLGWLEQQRYDFSADRAFQTRPLSNAAIAATFDVTERTVQRWMQLLENLGILERQFRKNIRHSYKNLLNRIKFCGFLGWFRKHKAPTPDNQSRPNKKDIINISISSEESGEKSNQPPSFPTSGSIRYDRIWREIAEKNLPSGRGRPCMNRVADKFRKHLKKYKIPFDAPNINVHWTNYCQRAPAVR